MADICDRAVVLERGRILVDGTAREATKALRADFDEQQTNEMAATPQGANARVVAVQPLGSDGRQLLTPVPDEDLVLRVTVESDVPLENWVLGVGIDSPTGQSVFGTNTQLLGMPMEPLTGRREIDVRLSGLRLGEGQYHVHGALAEWGGPTFATLSQAARLEVDGNGQAVGPVGVADISVTGSDRAEATTRG